MGWPVGSELCFIVWSGRSRFTPLPGAALAIALATRVYLPSEVQQELEHVTNQPLRAHEPKHGIECAIIKKKKKTKKKKQQKKNNNRRKKKTTQAQNSTGYCAGYQSVPAIRSAARTR